MTKPKSEIRSPKAEARKRLTLTRPLFGFRISDLGSSITLILVCAGALPAMAQAADWVTERRCTSVDASAEAFHRAETRRRAEFAQHVGTIEYIRWLNGRGLYLPLSAPYPMNAAAYYGYGGRYGRATGAFEPWPYLPGDIWGFAFGPARTPTVRLPAVTAPSSTRPAKPAGPPADVAPESVRRGPVSY